MTKQQLVSEIEHLSNAYIPELQSFIQYLKFKQAHSDNRSEERPQRLLPEQDPILQAIGSIDAEPFSETIDDKCTRCYERHFQNFCEYTLTAEPLSRMYVEHVRRQKNE